MICKICGKDNIGTRRCIYCGHSLVSDGESVAETIGDDEALEERVFDCIDMFAGCAYKPDGEENAYATASAQIGIIGLISLIIVFRIFAGGLLNRIAHLIVCVSYSLSVVFGVCGLVQCKKQGRDIGLAVFGIVLGVIMIIVYIIVVLSINVPWEHFVPWDEIPATIK